MHTPRTQSGRGGLPRPDQSGRTARIACAFVLLAQATIAEAQQLRGRLVDRNSEQPIASGILTLHGADSTVVASAVSDAAGRWTLRAPRPGEYFVVVRRLGYRPFSSAAIGVPVRDGTPVVIRMDQLAAQLDPVEARAVALKRNLELNGFFERQKSNFGHFLTPEAIDRRQASRVTDLLTTIPGVQIFVGGGSNVGPTQIGLRGSSVTDGALCRPRVFVDGLLYTRGDSRPVRATQGNATEQANLEERMDRALSLDDIGHPSTIAGIEVYRSATQVPVQFGGTSVETLCGVIVIWTRSGLVPERR